MSRKTLGLLAGAAVVYFLFAGVVLLPYPGAQYDEVLFSGVYYGQPSAEYYVETPWGKVATMLMTYLGALKSWVWAPVLYSLGPNLWTLRLPGLLIAAVSLIIFFLTARRLVPEWAALLGLLLLATDTNYLLSALYDWGPVALQHLFWCGMLYAGVRYAQEKKPLWLGFASACVGLALWDKAICLWLIIGFSASLLVFYARPVLALARQPRLAGVAVLAFVFGALPFISYNEQNAMKTFTANSGWTADEYKGKVWLLDRIVAGDGLFGYIARYDPAPLTAVKPLERVSVAIGRWTQEPHTSLQQALLAAVLLALPALAFGSYGRLILFLVFGGFLSLFLMFSTPGAGGSVHHVILLWPLPQLLIALACATLVEWAPRRGFRIAAVACGLAAATNIAVTNQFLAQLISCGPSVIWSDAVGSLVDLVKQRKGSEVFATEWGMLEQFRFLGRGRIGYFAGSDGVARELNRPEHQAYVRRALNTPNTLFVGHAKGSEVFPGTAEMVDRFAASEGFAKQLLATIPDRHGRPIFEVIQYVR